MNAQLSVLVSFILWKPPRYIPLHRRKGAGLPIVREMRRLSSREDNGGARGSACHYCKDESERRMEARPAARRGERKKKKSKKLMEEDLSAY